MRILSLLLLVLVMIIMACCDSVDSESVRTAGKEEPKIEQSNGGSKYERRILKDNAPIMDFDQLVAQYESAERFDWQKPNEVIAKMGDLSDKVVADIGAGTGYFTFHFVPLVKKVIAIDIDTRMIDFIETSRSHLPVEYRSSLETRLAKSDDPLLEDGEVDIVFLCNTYPLIEDRIDYFSNIYSKLKTDGLLVIVDFKKRRIPVGPDAAQKVTISRVEDEMAQAGFNEFVSDDRTLPYQYIYIARKN